MKSSLFTIFLLALLVSYGQVARATILGAEITYTCKGNGKYDVFVKAYRDCNGNTITQSNLNVTSANNSVSFSISQQTKVSTIDITGIGSSCAVASKCSGTYQYGYEEITWSMEVDLSSYSQCEWTLSWEQCCRDGNITTGQANENFFTYAILNKCLSSCNSSVKFTNPPMILACHNKDFSYNLGAIDTVDTGDSISYELASPLGAKNYKIALVLPWNPQGPLTYLGHPNRNLQWPGGFHLDPVSGDLKFRPTVLNQYATIVMEVKEWRLVNDTMRVVGLTRRDFVIKIISCTNEMPRISPPYSTQACAGQQTCLNIITDDTDTADEVRISWNEGISGATFTHNNGTVQHASGQVCWTPREADIRNTPYTFTVVAEDDNCPLNGRSSQSFSVFVRATPDAVLSAEEFSCGKVAVDFTLNQTYAGFQYEYRVLDSARNVVKKSYIKQDTLILQPGLHYLQLVVNTSTPCFNIIEDTLDIGDYVQVKLPMDTVFCEGETYSAQGVLQRGSGTINYEWWNLLDTSDLNNSSNTWSGIPAKSMKLALFVEDADGCKNSDTVSVKVNPLPLPNLGNDQAVCEQDTIWLSAGGDTLGWSYSWNTSDTSDSIQTLLPGTFIVQVTDSLSCMNADTVELYSIQPQLKGNYDQAICLGDSVFLSVSGADSYDWYDQTNFQGNGGDIPLFSGPSQTLVLSTEQTLLLDARNIQAGKTCHTWDTLNLTINPPANVSLGADARICLGDSLRIEAQGDTALSYSWSTQANSPFIWVRDSGSYHVQVQNIFGCKNADTVEVSVQMVPLDAGMNQWLCPGDTVQITANGADTYAWYEASSYKYGGANSALYTDSSFRYAVSQSFTWLVEGLKTENGLQCMGIDTVSVIAYNPAVIQNIIGDDQSLSTTVTYTYSVDPSGQTAFNWVVQNGTIISGQGTSTIEVTWNSVGAGSVQVIATSTDGCSSEFSKTVSITINSLFGHTQSQFRVYPNPGSGAFTLELTEETYQQSFIVLNALGQPVHKGYLKDKINVLNLDGLPAGVYILRVEGQGDLRLVVME